MKIHHYFTYMALAALAAVAVACSDDDKWEPGPAVKEGCQQVHFAGSNPAIALASSSGLNLKVARTSTSGSLTVPVQLISASEGVSVPSEVTFADGESEAVLTVSVPETATAGDNFDYELRLQGDEVDPYANLDGTSYFKGTISFAKLRQAYMYATGFTDALGWWREYLYDLGTGDYIIENFCGSGYGVRISVDDDNYVTVTPYNCTLYTLTASYGTTLYLTYNSDTGYTNAYPWGEDFPAYFSTLSIFNGTGTYKGYGRYYPSSDRILITAGALTAVNSGVETSGSYVYMYLKLYPEGEEAAISKPSVTTTPDVPE